MKRALSRAEYIRRVADSIYQTRTIQMIAHDLGLAPGEVDWSGPSRLVWSEVLVHAERNGQFEPLLRRIGDEVEDLRDVAIDAPTLQGSIPPPGGNWSPDWDVGREDIEKAALQAIEGNERNPFVVYGPSGYGKSWFLDRLAARLTERKSGIRTLVLPETAFTTHRTTRDFYLALMRALLRQVGRNPNEATARWNAEPDSPEPEHLRALVSDLAGSPPVRTCVLFDVPDSIWELDPPARNDFFNQIRDWRHERVGPLTEVRSVVAFSLKPAEWIDTLRGSPFNVPSFVLDGLNDAEVRALASLHGLHWTREELAAVQRALGGHPRHIRSVMCAAVKGDALTTLLKEGHLPGRIFHDTLLDLRETLRQRSSLWAGFQRVVREGVAPGDERDYRTLLSAGLLRSDDGRRFDVRYELLRRLIELPG